MSQRASFAVSGCARHGLREHPRALYLIDSTTPCILLIPVVVKLCSSLYSALFLQCCQASFPL